MLICQQGPASRRIRLMDPFQCMASALCQRVQRRTQIAALSAISRPQPAPACASLRICRKGPFASSAAPFEW